MTKKKQKSRKEKLEYMKLVVTCDNCAAILKGYLGFDIDCPDTMYISIVPCDACMQYQFNEGERQEKRRHESDE